MSAAMIGICMPSFLLGPLLVLVFGIYLDWLPVSGWGDIPGDKILPAITLGSSYAAANTWGLYRSPLVNTAHAIRASLLAIATPATLA